MLYTDECDTTPFGEPCVSVCDDDYMQAMRAEAYIFVRQMRRIMDAHGEFKIRLVNNSHDFGSYLSAMVYLGCEELVDAFDNEFPEYWDDIAINELLNSDDVVAYYEKHNPEHLQSLRNRQQNINAE